MNALRSFEAVARHLSFSRAAEELGVTHGAVSRQIASLEQQLDCKLLHRDAAVSMTDKGRELFEGIAPAFDRMVATLERLGPRAPRRSIVVNAPPTFMMRWLIPRMSGFQQMHPDVSVKLLTGIAPIATLRTHEYDVVIRRTPDHGDSPLQRVRFLDGTLLPVCSPDLVEGVRIESPADLAGFTLIEARTSRSGWVEWFRRAGVQLGADAEIVSLEEMFFALQAALDGLGVALMPSALVADDIVAERLVVPWSPVPVGDRDYEYAVSPLGRDPWLIGAFCDWLVAQGRESIQIMRDPTAGR
ncbi:transcriptional regulator GcvA [Pigmentiphaga soli]|uniref:Transcriptional regulator GcvA n=1 Tax=Pigmentiphaga soli TaxID=1007095 RepID=A0ABP8GC57_9BURK